MRLIETILVAGLTATLTTGMIVVGNQTLNEATETAKAQEEIQMYEEWISDNYDGIEAESDDFVNNYYEEHYGYLND